MEVSKEIAKRMAQERRGKAKDYLLHYMRLIAKGAGVTLTVDNDAEIELIVDFVLDAAKYAVIAEAERGSTGLPASIQEALNSGDGTYRP